jgi:hypothetical protein
MPFRKTARKRGAVAILAALLFAATQSASAQKVQTDVPALKDVFAGDFSIGCLLSYKHVGFPDDPAVPGRSSVVETAENYRELSSLLASAQRAAGTNYSKSEEEAFASAIAAGEAALAKNYSFGESAARCMREAIARIKKASKT